MRVRALFSISPSAYFGLPDGDKVVVRGQTGVERQLSSAVVDTRTWQIVAHGTLSEFRSEPEIQHEDFEINDVSVAIRDNFVETSTNAESMSDGVAKCAAAVDRLLRQLMVEQADFLQSRVLQYEANGVAPKRAPETLKLVHVTIYNAEELRLRLRTAARRAAIRDERLDRALLYYEHARFLHSVRREIVPTGSAHSRFVAASAYLNLFKGITTVLGEPGTDRDYQRRFREFGLPDDYWSVKIAPLKRLRDDSDVAHYDLDPQAIAEVEASFGEADLVCREVIGKYSDYLGSAC